MSTSRVAYTFKYFDMDIARSYRLLELKSTASLEEVKASYRRLARRWHPDVNPDNQQAQEMFIRVTQAYKTLLKVVPAPSPVAATVTAQPTVKVSVRRAATPPPVEEPPPSPPPDPVSATAQPFQVPVNDASEPDELESDVPPLSTADAQLKRTSFEQLQDLMKHQRLPRAIALVEALGQRLPQDQEVRQWQAIVYQRWARKLIEERKFNQARAYLKKALNTDPHNRSLWAEVERDFRVLERVF